MPNTKFIFESTAHKIQISNFSVQKFELYNLSTDAKVLSLAALLLSELEIQNRKLNIA